MYYISSFLQVKHSINGILELTIFLLQSLFCINGILNYTNNINQNHQIFKMFLLLVFILFLDKIRQIRKKTKYRHLGLQRYIEFLNKAKKTLMFVIFISILIFREKFQIQQAIISAFVILIESYVRIKSEGLIYEDLYEKQIRFEEKKLKNE